MSTDAVKTPEVTTLKAVEWTLDAPGQLHRSVTTLPSPASGEILVATQVGAISPGAERALLHGSCPCVPERKYPHQPGHLNVVVIRDADDRTLIGDRGVVPLGHRDYALIPYSRFIRIPPGISDEDALLGVIAADAHHAVEVAAVEQEEDCVVVGGGITGVLTAWELTTRTKGAIRLVERNPLRREVLRGIDFPGDVTVSERAGRYPFHTAFECASTASAFQATQAATRAGGSIVVVADGSHETYQLSGDFFAKNLYLGKTGRNPDLRGFLNEWFARKEDRSSLVKAAFRGSVRFDEFPQAYLKAALTDPEEQAGLLPTVVY